MAEDDTRNAETSPLACKALVALEYEPPPGAKDTGADGTIASRKTRDETPEFWGRVDTLFNVIDTRGDGDGRCVVHWRSCGRLLSWGA